MKKHFGRSPLSWLIIGCIFPICSCLEEEVPEISLPPRNFNPHPYQNGYGPSILRNGNKGPVLFPVNPEDAFTDDQQPLRQILNPNDIDSHPYATVAQKRRYKAIGRFHIQDNHVNPQVYKALASYASKVLTRPAAALKEYNDNPSPEAQKLYEFSYKVLDRRSGDDFSHRQSQNAEATRGEYRVKLPDGRLQIVSYTADKNGYNADVKYAENDQPAPLPLPLHYYQRQQQQQQQQIFFQSTATPVQVISSTPVPYVDYVRPVRPLQLLATARAYQRIPERVAGRYSARIDSAGLIREAEAFINK